MKKTIPALITSLKDAWQNSRRSGRKASLYNRIATTPQTYESLRSEYKDSWLIQKACNTKAQDGLKNWIDIKCDKEEALQRVVKKIEDMDLKGKLLTANQYAQAYGGGAIVLNVMDSTNEDEPVDIAKVLELSSINAIEGNYLPADIYQEDLTESNYGEPITFKSDSTVFNADRIIRFVGVQLDREGTKNCQGYGDPLSHKVRQDIFNFGIANDGVGDILLDFSTKVLSIEGLIDKLKDTSTRDDVRSRIELMIQTTAIDGALVISEKEKLEKISVPLAGIKDLLEHVLTVVSAGFGYPRAILFSQQLGTLAGAKEGTDDYIRQVEMFRDNQFRNPIDRILTLLFAAEKVEDFTWEFNSVATVSDTVLVENQERAAKTAVLLSDSNIITPEEARQPFVKGYKSSAIIVETVELAGIMGETKEADDE